MSILQAIIYFMKNENSTTNKTLELPGKMELVSHAIFKAWALIQATFSSLFHYSSTWKFNDLYAAFYNWFCLSTVSASASASASASVSVSVSVPASTSTSVAVSATASGHFRQRVTTISAPSPCTQLGFASYFINEITQFPLFFYLSFVFVDLFNECTKKQRRTKDRERDRESMNWEH